MNVNLELKKLQWSSTQASLYCDDEWILMYQIHDSTFAAECCLVHLDKLDQKHGLVRDMRYNTSLEIFENFEEAQAACEAHFRELMLKGFLQIV